MYGLPSAALMGEPRPHWMPAEVRGCPFGSLVCAICPTDIPAHVFESLDPLERAYANSFASQHRRREWVGGRVCLAAALATISSERRAILVAASGAPLLPPGRSGSISHKGPFIVALSAATSGGVGVDLERVESRDTGLQRKVLTSAERERLPHNDEDAAQAVVVHFSVKEAVYKALDPTDQQHLEFDDIETTFPTVTPRLWLPVDVRLPGRPLLVRAALLCDGEWIIATAMREPTPVGGA